MSILLVILFFKMSFLCLCRQELGFGNLKLFLRITVFSFSHEGVKAQQRNMFQLSKAEQFLC